MTTDDQTHIDRLDRAWDDLVSGRDPSDPVSAEIAGHLHALDDAPAPDPAFGARLWRNLEQTATFRNAGHPAPAASRNILAFPGGRRAAIAFAAVAAALALALVSVLIAGSFGSDDSSGGPDDRIGVAAPTATTELQTPPPDPTGEIFAETTPTTGPTSTAETPPTAGPTATVEPTSPLPTPTVPVQLGGPPPYYAMEDFLNAVDVIVHGTVLDPVTTGDTGTRFEFQVEGVVRGELDAEVISVLASADPPVAGQRFVLLLRDFTKTDGVYSTEGNRMVPLEGELVVGLDYEPGPGADFSFRYAYAGRTVDEMIQDIQAIPSIDPAILSLLEQYGWTSISRGYLWPQTMPDDLTAAGPFPRRQPAWSVALEASGRIGLDFSNLAGQQVQVLPWVLEREMEEGQRLILAYFVIHDQEIAGAWIEVTAVQQPFGLDQRDTVLEIPVAIPTPTPTATPAIATEPGVNPVEFYQLREATGLRLCWFYCEEQRRSPEEFAAILAALDRDLAREEFSAHPTPTPPDGDPPEPTPDLVSLIFEFGDSRYTAEAIPLHYDRVNGIIQLPYHAGWVPAPPELEEIMAGIEVPPPPTKP